MLKILKGISMATLLAFNALTSKTISSHEILCSMKVKVHQKLQGFLPDYKSSLVNSLVPVLS